MSNSILNNTNSNTQMIQQLRDFGAKYKGDPKQAVMQMLQQGKISNTQLQQAMQMARQIQGMLR